MLNVKNEELLPLFAEVKRMLAATRDACMRERTSRATSTSARDP